MPLFDAIESDVTAFFVSQGTVYDSLVKAFMDRMAVIESSVALMRTDVTNKFNLVNQRIDASTAEAAEVSAATAATAAAAAASAALASLPPTSAAEISLTTQPDVTHVDHSGCRREELEYYIMTLSRQLNMVLEVLFQPHGSNNAVETVQAKQTELQSISDVLTENEAILMQLAAQHDDEKLHQNTANGSISDEIPIESAETSLETTLNSTLNEAKTQLEPNQTTATVATLSKSSQETPQFPSSETKTLSSATKEAQSSPLVEQNEEVGRTLPDNQDGATKEDEQEDEDSDEERDQLSADISAFQPLPEGSRHRRKSFFQSCQDLQRQEEERLRGQKRLEEELMRRMHELLLQSRSHRHQEHMELWHSIKTTRRRTTKRWFLLSRVSSKSSSSFTTNERSNGVVNKKGNSVDDLEKRFVSADALQQAGALWLKTAADNCIYGVNPETLSTLHRDLQEFKSQLDSHPVRSPAMSTLHEAVDRALQLLQHPSSGSEQENNMYTLRQLLAKLDSSYRAAATEHEEFPLPAVGFLADAIHCMELGTANLLDAIDFQQEHFQQTFAQHQTGLDKLQKELWRQQEVELGLRTQLSACPSKEDTLRLVQDLRDQLATSTADSASRVLDTVEDLRYRMTGLPNAQMLEQLANDLHAKTDRLTRDLDTTTGKLSHDLRQKADRSEIDRLQSLVESSGGVHPPSAYLTKSPLKCLSCDQHLPFAQAPQDVSLSPERPSRPGSPTSHRPGSPPRSPTSSPIIYHNQQSTQMAFNDQQPESSQTPDGYNDLGINMEILQEMFAASTSALERRRRQRQHLQMQLLRPQPDHNDWVVRQPTFLNLDDGRNRIPLRKVQLSEHVIYGPAITPNAFRKRQLGLYDERPKTAAQLERRSGGEIITRTASSTVIVRPFSELTGKRLQKK
ncbi:hypothetical protein PInf_026084 [Phytophthora infestans]|nr:hypothetical protein PInf_026084 [Phytophthora infestans]